MTPEELKEIKDRADIPKLIEALEEANEKVKIAVEALMEIERKTDGLRPNSGHMYLATINYVGDEAKEALEKIGRVE